MRFDEAIAPFHEEPLTRQVILSVLKEYKRPNDKIGELIKSGELISASFWRKRILRRPYSSSIERGLVPAKRQYV